MKALMTSIVFAIMLLGCNSPTQLNEKTSESSNPLEFSEFKLKVKGMTCEGCETAVKRSLERIEGVYESEASFQKEWVSVKYDPERTSKHEISEAIIRVGYMVVGEFGEEK